MDTSLIIQTVTALSSFAGRVAVASDLQSAIEAVKPFASMPCAIIYGVAERAGDNGLATGGPRQQITASFRLLLINRDVSDPYGCASLQNLQPAIDASRAALLGLVPATNYDPLLLMSGQLAYAQAGTVCWLDEWRTHYYLTKH